MSDMAIAPGGGGGLLVQAARNLAGQVRQGCPGCRRRRRARLDRRRM